jgi:hypothetical protein
VLQVREVTAFSFKPRHIWYVLGGGAVAVLLVTAGLLVSIWFVMEGFGACKSIVLNAIPSPDKKKSVVIFRKECNATVPDSTQASIVSAKGPFAPEQASSFLSVRGNQDVIVTWSGEHVVRIGLIPGGDTVYKRDPNVGDVKIEYE